MIPISFASSLSDVGDGPPVVLIHPLGADKRFWERLSQHLSGRRLIAYDLPGHGGRSVPADDYQIVDLADDLDRLLHQLMVESVSIVGVSIGGLVAQAFASKYPHRTVSVVLVDTVAVYPPGFAQALADRADLVMREGTSAILQPTLDMWFTPTALSADPLLTLLVTEMLGTVSPLGYAQACRALVAADLTRTTPLIDRPTTVVCGSDDVPVFIDGAGWLERSIPGARVHWLAGGKHAAALECIAPFAEILDRVLPR